MDSTIAVYLLGLLVTSLYLFCTGQIALGIFALLFLFASLKIVEG